MIHFIRMKKAELKVKAMLYGAIAALIDNQREVLDLMQKMYLALKDTPAQDLQKELVGRLAEIIHEENQKKTGD